MTSHKRIVELILADLKTDAARKLRAGNSVGGVQAEPPKFRQDDITALENAILKQAPRSALPDKLLTTLHAMIRAVEPDNELLRQMAVFSYPKYKNIVAGGFAEADEVYARAMEWLKARMGSLPPHAGTPEVAEFVVASIVEFQVLNTNMVLPLLESLGDGRVLSMHDYLVGIPVAIGAWESENTQKRFLTIRGPIAKWLKKRLDAPQVKARIAQRIEAAAGRQTELLKGIDLDITATSEPAKDFTIEKLIEAACQVAIPHMPTSVLAVRRGTAVSHALDLDVLARIESNNKLSKLKHPKQGERPRKTTGRDGQEEELKNESGEGKGSEEDGEEDEESGEPEWMLQLRAAVKKKAIDDRGLAELAESEDVCGRCAAEFAKQLRREKCRNATIYKYVFLIANRLLVRLGDRDPKSLEIDEWEEQVEQILDEDAMFHRKVYSEGGNLDETGYSRSLLKALRRFARFMKAGGHEANPVMKMIPPDGLIHVNAHMVTVDECLRALGFLRSWHTAGESRYLRDAARVALILGFRCGLRQAEVAYLRVRDFDALGEEELLATANVHLHVRPWFLRQLKTSNAKRDIPLSVLIPHKELEEVMEFVAEARKAGGTEGRLFHGEMTPAKGMKFERVLAELKKAFETGEKGKPGVKCFHFHMLRHSAANIWLLKLWPELGQVADHVFRRHPKTLEWIRDGEAFRKRLFGDSTTRSADLQAIALLLGHGSAATTVEHYLHVVDWYGRDRTEPEV